MITLETILNNIQPVTDIHCQNMIINEYRNDDASRNNPAREIYAFQIDQDITEDELQKLRVSVKDFAFATDGETLFGCWLLNPNEEQELLFRHAGTILKLVE